MESVETRLKKLSDALAISTELLLSDGLAERIVTLSLNGHTRQQQDSKEDGDGARTPGLS